MSLDKVTCRFFPYMHDISEIKRIIKSDAELGLGPKIVFGHFDIQSFDYGNGLLSEEGLELSDFKGMLKVVSGHYHKYQAVGNVIYLGTPFSHSFGESNQEKFIGLFDTSKGKMELVPTPFPQHVTLELNADEYAGHEKNDVDIFRVVLTGTQENINKFTKLEGVKYIEQPTSVVKESVVNETDTPQEQFQKWAMEIKGYSKDIVKRGLEILADV